MKNITLAIDDETLSKVRRYAAAHHTTINDIVRDHLARIANNADRLKEAVSKLRRMSETSTAELGPGYKWGHEDCYGR